MKVRRVELRGAVRRPIDGLRALTAPAMQLHDEGISIARAEILRLCGGRDAVVLDELRHFF